MFTTYTYLIYTYEEDSALNNLKWLICYKKKEENKTTHHFYVSFLSAYSLSLLIVIKCILSSAFYLFLLPMIYKIL